jgi:ankyrin repeat protein
MPSKKAIKAFVQYIQRGDTEAALSALADDPALTHARCSSPPKKYDGQSLLHVAMRNGSSAIAIALIDAGSDVNLIEESQVNDWNSPPLHDGI